MNLRWMPILIFALLVSGASFGYDGEKRESMPDSHRANWEARHQFAAKSDAASCNGCHKPIFCVDCHSRHDSVQEKVHRRNYMFYHSIEARTNPRKCDECHRPNYCNSCHRNPSWGGS